MSRHIGGSIGIRRIVIRLGNKAADMEVIRDTTRLSEARLGTSFTKAPSGESIERQRSCELIMSVQFVEILVRIER